MWPAPQSADSPPALSSIACPALGGQFIFTLNSLIFDQYFVFYILLCFSFLSSQKGLRAESARAVTGRRYPHSGKGEDFLTGQLNIFTETAVTPEQKVEKSFPRSEINRHAEG